MTDRRAPVQSSVQFQKPRGSISWDEHVEAWEVYAQEWKNQQSAQRVAERGGFGYQELVDFLGREPNTWEPTDAD